MDKRQVKLDDLFSQTEKIRFPFTSVSINHSCTVPWMSYVKELSLGVVGAVYCIMGVLNGNETQSTSFHRLFVQV